MKLGQESAQLQNWVVNFPCWSPSACLDIILQLIRREEPQQRPCADSERWGTPQIVFKAHSTKPSPSHPGAAQFLLTCRTRREELLLRVPHGPGEERARGGRCCGHGKWEEGELRVQVCLRALAASLDDHQKPPETLEAHVVPAGFDWPQARGAHTTPPPPPGPGNLGRSHLRVG